MLWIFLHLFSSWLIPNFDDERDVFLCAKNWDTSSLRKKKKSDQNYSNIITNEYYYHIS